MQRRVTLPLEAETRKQKLAYVDLDGDIKYFDNLT